MSQREGTSTVTGAEWDTVEILWGLEPNMLTLLVFKVSFSKLALWTLVKNYPTLVSNQRAMHCLPRPKSVAVACVSCFYLSTFSLVGISRNGTQPGSF
ncbi:hypothetical protein V6N13_010799 [Hibiscus sabdariffa]|uniref:Uncharacterized protein n=1 Tax=Hibiscus sabdariffa TaxID=183260 RepID=A0ABR2SAY9_9ROSI